MSLKAALCIIGVEPPKWKDVGPVLKHNVKKYPDWSRDRVPGLASMSRKLRRERETSLSGDEESGTPLEELYTRDDALEALNYARHVYESCGRILEEASATQD